MTTEKKNRKKRPIVKIDKSLDEFNNRVMFPKKLALAEELLKHAIFPKELQERMKRESIILLSFLIKEHKCIQRIAYYS